MKRIVIICFYALFAVASCECVNHTCAEGNTPSSEIDVMTQELCDILESKGISEVLKVENDPEVDFISRVLDGVNDTSGKIIEIVNDSSSISGKTEFSLHIMRVMSMASSFSEVNDTYKKHIQYLQELLSSEGEPHNSYNGIKKMILDKDALFSDLSQYYDLLTEFENEKGRFEAALQEVLELVSEDLNPAINKMTGPEVQNYYKSSLRLLKKTAEFERARAAEVIKASETYRRIQ
jgi:hypothetical protein